MASSEASTTVPPTPSAPTQFELQQSPPARQDPVEQQPPPYEPTPVSAFTAQPIATQQLSVAPNEQIQQIHDDPNYRKEEYDPQMVCSLCMLVTCLIFCNFLSLMFTVPAVIFSWRAVQAAQENKYRNADQRKSVAYTCVLLAMFQFIIMIILLAIAAAVFTLVQTDVINISLSE